MNVRQHRERMDRMTQAVYDAALDPGAWGDVMQLMKSHFGSTSETFYLLDRPDDVMRPIHIDGIAQRWLDCFAPAYFSNDNPWINLSQRLHQPGVVRTNERLAALTHDNDVLYRSSYYNEWMRPQGFRYTIGNTLLRDTGLIANVTLLRSADMPTFGMREVNDFEGISQHLTRAVRLSLQIEDADAGARARGTVQALNALPQAAFAVEAGGKLLHANASGEQLLRDKAGLLLVGGKLVATRFADRPRVAALMSGNVLPPALADGVMLDVSSATSPAGPRRLLLQAMPISGALPGERSRWRRNQPTWLVLAGRPSADLGHAQAQAPQRLVSAFGFTPSEARLASALAAGHDLRSAASECGISYGTARGYLKVVFQKTGTHRQAELLACMRRELPH